MRALLDRIGADPTQAVDLGGTMSLNLHAVDRGVVLRVHPPFVSPARLQHLQDLRAHVARAGLVVGEPAEVDGSRVLTAGTRLAEVEPHLAATRQEATWSSYVWMFDAMGVLHRALASYDGALADPVVATYGSPISMRADARATAAAVAHDKEASAIAGRVLGLVDALESMPLDRSALGRQVVHGDVRLANVAAGSDGAPVYFDFGFAARRPRIHDLAYALSWIVLRPDDSGCAEDFRWDLVPELLAAYEQGAASTLARLERRALASFLAAVPLYLASIAFQVPDPANHLCGERSFLRIAEWVLTHPEEVLGGSA